MLTFVWVPDPNQCSTYTFDTSMLSETERLKVNVSPVVPVVGVESKYIIGKSLSYIVTDFSEELFQFPNGSTA